MISAGQSRAARGLLAWTQERLASKAGVSLSTVRDFEAERRRPIPNNLAAIQRAFEGAGVVFTNGGEQGVKLGKAR
jgi:transcriptional regulator with XRE-family HTH domain